MPFCVNTLVKLTLFMLNNLVIIFIFFGMEDILTYKNQQKYATYLFST